jgi:hypothetical protein
MLVSSASGLSGMTPIPFTFNGTGFRGGPPMIVSSTCTGSGTFGGTPPGGRLRPAPLGMPAVDGRLVVEESGDIRDSDDERGFRPGRRGSGAGLSVGCRRRGAGE